MELLSIFALLIVLSRGVLRVTEAQAAGADQALLREIIVYQQQQASFSTRGKSFFHQQFGGWQHSVFESADWKLLETQTETFLQQQAGRSSARHNDNFVFFQPQLHPFHNLKLNLQNLLLAEEMQWDIADSGPGQAAQVFPTGSDESTLHRFTLHAGHYKYPNTNAPKQCAVLYVEPVERFRGCMEHFLSETQAVSARACLDDISAEDFSKTLDRLELTAPHCFQEYLHMFSDYGVTNYFEHVEPELKALRRQLRDSSKPQTTPAKRAKFKRLIRMLQQQGRPPYSIPYIAWNQTILRLQQCEVVVLHRPESYALLAQKLPAHVQKADSNISAILSQASKDILARQLYSIAGVSNKQKVFTLRGKNAIRSMRGDEGRCAELTGEKRRTVERKLALEVVLFKLANEQVDRQLLQAQLPVLKSCLLRREGAQVALSRAELPSLLIANGGATSYVAETLLYELTGMSVGKYWQRASSASSPPSATTYSKKLFAPNTSHAAEVHTVNCRADTNFLYMESGLFRMQPSRNPNQSVVIDTTLFDAFEDRVCRRTAPVLGSATVSDGEALLAAISKGVVIMRDPYLYAYRNAFRNLSIEMESSGNKLSRGQMEDRLVKTLQTFASGGTPFADRRSSASIQSVDNEEEDKSDSRLVKDLQLQILNREDIYSKLSLAQEQEIARFQELKGNESEIFASVFQYFFDPLTFVSLFRTILQQNEMVYAKSNFLFMSLEAILDASFQLLHPAATDLEPTLRANAVSQLLQFAGMSAETVSRLQCGFVDTMRRLSSSSSPVDILSLQEETLEMKSFFQRYPRLFVETRALLERKWKHVAIVVEGTPTFLF